VKLLPWLLLGGAVLAVYLYLQKSGQTLGGLIGSTTGTINDSPITNKSNQLQNGQNNLATSPAANDPGQVKEQKNGQAPTTGTSPSDESPAPIADTMET
jgi:hypothetical protein